MSQAHLRLLSKVRPGSSTILATHPALPNAPAPNLCRFPLPIPSADSLAEMLRQAPSALHQARGGTRTQVRLTAAYPRAKLPEVSPRRLCSFRCSGPLRRRWDAGRRVDPARRNLAGIVSEIAGSCTCTGLTRARRGASAQQASTTGITAGPDPRTRYDHGDKTKGPGPTTGITAGITTGITTGPGTGPGTRHETGHDRGRDVRLA